jgi:hypothetical protein
LIGDCVVLKTTNVYYFLAPKQGEVETLKTKKYLLVLFAATLMVALAATTVYAAVSSSKTVSSSGKVVTINLAVYSDSACTQPVSAINWGSLQPGGNTTYNVWIKNTGTAQVTLSMTTSGWSPSSASQSLTLTWNRNNAALTANQVVNATLTLIVSPTAAAIDSYSFNVVFTGTA